MRSWNLPLKPPLGLVLSADARLGASDYADDQIWELNMTGDPPAVALRTTFGLRARSLRLFPRFVLGEQAYNDPAEFARSPLVRNYYPNFARLEFSPFPDIDVSAEFWVPQSHAIQGRYEFTNNTPDEITMQVEIAVVLTPSEGQRMNAEKIQATPVLVGQTDNLQPLLFMPGGAQPAMRPHPCLVLELKIVPGDTASAAWCQAALYSPEESFELARRLSSQPWDPQIAHLELLNAGQVEIYTGDPEWDLAFYMSQVTSASLFVGPTEQLPDKSFVQTRQPDQGHSLRGDGSDYSHLWGGQSPLEACYMADYMLPAYPELVRGILRNYFAIQEENGFIDWKPGLGGQRSRVLATPLLAGLTWRLYLATQDTQFPAKEFLAESLPHLERFLDAWFSPEHDADQDSLPEWDHPMQTGIEEHPHFSPWLAWSQGADICTAESPGLGAMLYSECRSLAEIARVCGDPATVEQYTAKAQALLERIEAMWDEEAQSYVYQDRNSHTTPEAQFLCDHTGAGKIILHRRFDQPVRLLARIHCTSETRPHPQVFVHGESSGGKHRVERIPEIQIRWSHNQGILTGERVYTAIEMVEMQGLLPGDQVTLSTVGYDCQDLTLLLPLWAGVPSDERAERLIDQQLLNPNAYNREYGMPTCPQAPPAGDATCQAVNLPLNQMVAEGMLKYGRRSEGAQLVKRLMAGVIGNFKRYGKFLHTFNASSGEGIGERNILNGLAPLGLFLDALGVRLASPYCVYLQGFNPFPWAVTVKYRGLTVMRQRDKSVVIFPDGQTIEVSDPEPVRVCLQG